MKKPLLLTAIVSLVFLLSQTSSKAQGFERTMTYHQITAFTESHVGGQDWQHLISDNGNKVVWYKQINPKKVIVMNPDGTGYDEIVNVGTERMVAVDISADGTKVVYQGGGSNHRLNFVNADGSGHTQLIELSNLRMQSIRINADGTKAYFVVSYNTSIVGGGSIERGVYSINLDGTGLTQLVGPTEVATALGVSAADISSFSGAGAGAVMEISHDGAEMVFVAKDDAGGNRHVFTMSGGSVTQISSGVDWIGAVGISYTGTKVAYTILDAGERIGYVANYDGSGHQEIANNDDYTFTNGNSLGDKITITEDGTKVMFDSYSHLFNTDGSGVIQLSANTVGSAGNPIIVGTFNISSMSKDGSRVLFSFRDPIEGLSQLAIMDLNPSNMGGSPMLSEVTMTPNAVSLSPPTNAMISAKITPANSSDSVDYVGNVFLLDGIFDGAVEDEVFYDDGTSVGDLVAGDNVYTHNGVGPYSNAEVGPRLLRINAEVFDANGMLHGTAVDVPNPFHVVPDTNALGMMTIQREDFSLGVYPNPFSENAVIEFSLAKNSKVRLSVFNQLGELQKVLLDTEKSRGDYQVNWNGTDSDGRELSAGIYFLKIEVNGEAQTHKLVFSK